jgi:sulfite exporter TauE/SafE
MTGSSALFFTGLGTGLLAGATSCAAVQVGLLTGAVRDAPHAAGPVAAFLSAKLAVHGVLGALLGMLGTLLLPGPQIRAALLLLAAAVLAVFALDLLGVPIARRSHCAAGARRRRDPRLRRPAVLGASTVLLPCGLTLSAELLAVGSRSAAGGAAVMTGFVLGTAPLSAVVGMALGRGLEVLRGRLTVLAGAVLLAVAAWTLASGLRLGGWLPVAPRPAAAPAEHFVTMDAAGVQVVTVWAVDRGYRPAALAARAGARTVLQVRTRGNRGCTRVLVIPARGVQRVLPADGVTRIDLGVPAAGRLTYGCASGHYRGSVSFR